MRVAIVGTGYVSHYYLITARIQQEVEVAGVLDLDRDRAERVAKYFGVQKIYDSLDQLLSDPTVDIVANLTDPHSHYEITKACLEANKHVYTEKPIAMDLSQATELTDLAEERGLKLSSAPCSLLGECAQTLRRELSREENGPARLAYAELDDGPIYRMKPDHWKAPTGIPWPYQNEYAIGCTFEHAGYYLTWLTALFGPVITVSGLSKCLVTEKEGVGPQSTPDFSVAVLTFEKDFVARITCTIVAPRNMALTVVTENYVYTVLDGLDYFSPITRQPRPSGPLAPQSWRTGSLANTALRFLGRSARSKIIRPRPTYARPGGILGRFYLFSMKTLGHNMDYFRGIVDLARAVRTNCRPGLPSDHALHVTEVSLAMTEHLRDGGTYQTKTRFTPLEPPIGYR